MSPAHHLKSQSHPKKLQSQASGCRPNEVCSLNFHPTCLTHTASPCRSKGPSKVHKLLWEEFFHCLAAENIQERWSVCQRHRTSVIPSKLEERGHVSFLAHHFRFTPVTKFPLGSVMKKQACKRKLLVFSCLPLLLIPLKMVFL